MKLTPEDLQRIEDKKVANILRKIYTEKRTPTAREDAILFRAGIVPGSGPGDLVTAPVPVITYVSTWDELALALSIDERTLFNFRKRHAREIVERKALLERADGRHCVTEWKKFAAEFDELKGRGANNPDLDHIDERELRLRERRLAVELGEHKLAVQKAAVLPLTEYQVALRQLVGGFDGALKQFSGRAADAIALRTRQAALVMLRRILTPKQFEKLDSETAVIGTAEIEAVIEAEIEVLRRILATADFMEPAPASD